MAKKSRVARIDLRWFVYVLILAFIPGYQNCSPQHTQKDFSSSSADSIKTLYAAQCNPETDARVPVTSPLMRLSKYELKNTLIDLFSPHLSAVLSAPFTTQITTVLDGVPAFSEEQSMDIVDQSVTVTHLDAQLLIAEAVADFLTANPSVVTSILGTCSSTRTTDACKRSFLSSFGKRILRKSLNAEEEAFYLQTMNTSPSEAYASVIAQMIMSPHFYYQTQFGTDATSSSDATVELAPYEKASKLSYFLLRSMPDNELFLAAERGELDTNTGIKTQVQRLLGLPLVRQRLARSFGDEWLKINHTSEGMSTNTQLAAYMTEISSTNLTNLRQNIMNEAYDYIDYIFWTKNGNYQDLMTSPQVFPRTDDMAAIYGTSKWNGNPSTPITADAQERAGLFSRAQFLYTGTGNTRPIMRGIHVYRNFLCLDLRLPDDNANPPEAVITDDMTNQDYVRAITENDGTSCVRCHKTIINPLGFSFDNYDSVGRFRAQERVFAPESSDNAGEVLAVKAVKPAQTVNVSMIVDGPVANSVELAHRLASNDAALYCFSSKLWAFAQKQAVKMNENSCSVYSVYDSLKAGSIVDSLAQIPLQPEFMRRKIK